MFAAMPALWVYIGVSGHGGRSIVSCHLTVVELGIMQVRVRVWCKCHLLCLLRIRSIIAPFMYAQARAYVIAGERWS